jgi:DNA-directed RNA polymerase specialized sigma24 family protein
MFRMKVTSPGAAMLSDAELVRLARQGDISALGVLFERHRAPLYALALRILGHGPRAQDAVQETFLIALRRIDHLREPAAVGKWLRTVLHNTCLM